MRRPPILSKIVAIVALLTLPAIGLAQQPGMESLKDRVKVHVLPNGLKFLLLERHNSPTVSFHVYFNVGSVDEELGQTGIAHLYEHMAFKGTKQIGTTDYEAESKYFPVVDRLQAELSAERDKGASADASKISQLQAQIAKAESDAEKYEIPNEFSKILESNGATGLNAQTERDQTHYLLNLPSNKIELWMAMESDRMRNEVLRELYKERDVVMEEVRRTIDTNPITKLLLEETITTAYHAHPYGLHSGIGWTSDVSHLTRPEVQAFFDKYYGAANATVAIVGDFDTAKVIPMIDHYFGPMRAGEKTPRRVTVEPPQDGERRVELEANYQPAVILGYHRPDALSDDAVVYNVIGELLGTGRTSRLYRNLVDGKKIASGVFVFSNPILITGKYPSLIEIAGLPLVPQHNTQELETAIYAELDQLKSQPVDKQELQKIINQVDAGFVRSLTDNETLANLLVFAEGLEGDWRRLLTYRQRLAAVTPDDIMRVARQTFTKANRTVAYIVPKESDKPAAAASPAASPEATQDSLTRGQAVVDAALATVGGPEKPSSIKDYVIHAQAKVSVQGNEIAAQVTQQAVLPDKVRAEISIPAMGQNIVQAFNGTSAWVRQGGQTMDAPPQNASDMKAEAARDAVVFFLRLPVGAKTQALPDESVDGKPADVVEVTAEGDFKQTLFFDKSNHRLVKSTFQTVSPLTGEKTKAEETYSDFRQQDGFWIPFHTLERLNGEKFQDLTLTDIKINPGVSPSIFEKSEEKK
jgi:predicted Zn-dependent peptidase